ncbi:MAG TPA: methenyltetrahydromethanopterin cyclohydrolase [Burkholderiales bacterium]
MSEATAPAPSVSARAAPLVAALIADAASLRLGVERLPNGAVVVDAGIDAPGGLEAGRRIAEICLGGLGQVLLQSAGFDARWPIAVSVHAQQPVLACLGSQYAGWSLSHREGEKTFHALASGPGRALAAKEPLFAELGYRDRGDAACLVLEVDRRPPAALADKIARDCGVSPERVTLILTPTRSLAGTVQIIARSLEVALHKAHALGFALVDIVDGHGTAPLPPPAADFIGAMGRTNDAIIYGGTVQLYVRGGDDAARELAQRLPASASRDYGKPFAQVFEDYGRDFFRIDPMLFSPARVVVTALASGRTFEAGGIDTALLERSFGGGS